MHVWGLTIDIVSCIALQLAVGLCVDYAAHIGHTFMTKSKGTRTERVTETVQEIGVAVLSGGGSTIMALSMLSVSEAYIFQAFFKVQFVVANDLFGNYSLTFLFLQIFMLVVIFGLFHGIVFLPVILSIIGPQPYEIGERLVSDAIAPLKRKLNVGNGDADINEMMNLQHQNGVEKRMNC